MTHSVPHHVKQFATTRWSMVATAGQIDSPEARTALAELCERYWQPLYAFIRHRGYERESAQDLTQAFIAELLEKKTLRTADRERGRFRSFLLACLKNFLSHDREKQQAQKRGGGKLSFTLPIHDGEQRYEPVAKEPSPEAAFERVWMNTVLKQVMDRLMEPYRNEGKLAYFSQLVPGIYGSDYVDYEAVAAEWAMNAEAVRQAVSRLRKRYRELLLVVIEQTVADPNDVDDEVRHLFTIAAGK